MGHLNPFFLSSWLIFIYMAKTIPVPVLVARWSALAAGTTALGSVINTLWTSEPWWVKTEAERAVNVKTMALTASAPSLDLYQKAWQFVHHYPIASALIIICGFVLVWSLMTEYHHHKNPHIQH